MREKSVWKRIIIHLNLNVLTTCFGTERVFHYLYYLDNDRT